MAFRKAERKQMKLRAALCGPAGSGKTYSALLLAAGLGQKIAVIDSERGSAELYSDLMDYDVAPIVPPYTPQKYITLIREAADNYDVLIVDSLSHAWAGEGGILDMHADATQSETGKNSWTAWRKITPKHNELVDALLAVPCHLIATLRSKMAYEQTDEKGSKKIVKLGMAPIQREGLEYEFTLVLDLNHDHLAVSTKDRTRLWDGRAERLTAEHGRELREWLESGRSDNPITTEQHEALLARLGELQIPHDWLLRQCWKKWRASELTTLRESQYSELLAALPSLATKYLENAA